MALRPKDAEPWAELARTLRRRGEPGRADEAFASAYAAEPTNARLLWERADNLRQAGRTAEADRLLSQLAAGTWQPRFHDLQRQARRQLGR